jgi:hypothetical protein
VGRGVGKREASTIAKKILQKNFLNLPENGKKFCCQRGNKKDITLFPINPKITEISKQIRVTKCQKFYSI